MGEKMVLKDFGGLAAIQPAVQEQFTSRLLDERRQLHEQFLELSERYTQNPTQFGAVSSKIKEYADSVAPLFSTPHTKDTDLEQIKKVLASVQQLIENPQVAPATEVTATAAEVKQPALSQETTSAVETTLSVDPIVETVRVEKPTSIEQMKSNLTTLDEQVNALYEKKTIPFYEELKARGLNEHFNVKRVYGNEGQGGQLLRAFDICAIARTHFIEQLSQATEATPSKELLTLYKKFDKQVAVLERQVEWHIKNIKAFIETAALENVIPATPVEAVSLEKLILDRSMRAPEETIDENKVEVAEAEKLEFEEVQRMQASINQIEQEIKLLQEQTTWQPSHESGNTKAMIDQFDRTLADYYEQPSAALFKLLKNTFTTIETFFKEVKDAHEVAKTGVPVTIEQPQESTQSPEVSAAEQMTNNVITIADKYKAERESLRGIVDDLLAKPNLPTDVQQSLSFAKSEMLTRLGLLSYTDPQYMQLRERVKEVINAAQQLTGEDITVAPAPKIEGVANHFLAPETRKRLSENPKLRAALLVAMVAMVSPNHVSDYRENFVVAAVDTESPLSRMGDRAQWIGDDASTILAAAEEDEPKKIVVVRPNTGEEEVPQVTPETSTNTRIANINFAANGETPPVVMAEAGALPVVNLSEDNLPKISEVVVNRFGYEPAALEVNTEVTEISNVDTSVPEPTASTVAELDPKSPVYQETLARTESVATSNNVVEVLRGNEATYPDRAINPLLAAVDATGIPEVLANKLRAEEKEAFLSDANRLKAAGVRSGQRSSTFPGEKINYSDPVERLKQRFNEYRQYLNVPHTEVAVEGDNLTKLVEKSYARDLAVLSPADRLPVVEEALATYLATPGALENLKLKDKDTVPTAAVVPLQVMARYLADAVAKKVLTAYESGSASEVIVDDGPVTETSVQEADTNIDTFEESGGASEVIEEKGKLGEVTSPEEYPGGVMAYSQAYNEKLASLGIDPKTPSMIDSWFQPRTTDNRALLEMTVGELTKIMMQAPLEIAKELQTRKVSLESANELYKLIITARASGQTGYGIDSLRQGKEIIQERVLAEAPKSSN